MRISNRKKQIATLKRAERDLTAMFREMQQRIAGVLATAAGPDGTIPFEQHDDVRAAVQRVVEGYFVKREVAFGAIRHDEAAHLQALIEQARRELGQAKKREKVRIMARLRLLTKRYTALQRDGVRFVSISDDVQGQTEYGRILADRMEQAVTIQVERHAEIMRRYLRDAPDVLAALERGS